MNSSNAYYSHRFSIKTDEQVLQLLSAACIAEWVQQKPSANAIMTLDDGESIHLPVFALRRRNAVVAPLPDARVPSITA
ncbi:uncharacterized protein B0P05DRAFT_530819 [Gilbertella persicaria]|uniref:uncharacterized protein n=1 Tax=Gilbertella persicaria TaxID=101096 RepID=UPI002220C43A|nr:uncharacterized protein B0P05DRAFT_530819 [Gilbertella persicaria]KAI8087954.1 hypothetical protein B0P05DRAFT_530819 [Gilbertella persicaria]